MVKKVLNVFMCLGLLLQNFLLAIPVMAEEKTPIIKINGLTQGGEDVELVDGYYIIDKYDTIILDYELENISDDSDYYIKVETTNGGSGSFYYGPRHEYIYLDGNSELQTYTINVCDEWECNKKYASKTITFKLDFYDEIKDSKIIISDIKQGNEAVLVEEEYSNKKIYLNNKQNITYKLKGENLADDAKYVVYSGHYGNSEVSVLGSELEKGIELTHYTNLEGVNTSFWISAYLDGLNMTLPQYYSDGTDTYPYFNFYMEEDETLANYTTELTYTNFEDKLIELSNFEYRDYYIINSNYHNKDNTLSLKIAGDGYEDKDYLVALEVKRGNETIYGRGLKLNGLLLNDGYNLELSDLILELNKSIEESELYSIYVEVDNVSTETFYKYNSIGRDISLESTIFFENGKKNLSAFRGSGNYFYGGGIYDTNKDVFSKYSYIYLRYAGENFNNDEEYDYVLEYGKFTENPEKFDVAYEVELKKGKVNGLVLNTVGLFFQVDNYKNYENPSYRLTIKKGDEVLYSSSPVLNIVDSPTLANASLKANSKNLYLQTSDQAYIATRNAPIDIVISGLGFDENTDYDFHFCYYKSYADGSWSEENQKCEEVKIKGKDLNNGTAKIHFDEKIEENAISYDFYVSCDLKDAYMQNVAIQGGFGVTFVDSKEFFPNLTKYFVDNVSDLIKNISKNTTALEFANNIDVKNNGKVTIYDTTGTEEITGNVGTGMIARVKNEYDENILDLDVAVKGDVSGDGNISITDLVTVKRHLAQVENLTGVYEVAANVTDSGKVGPTDLVRIARDVAKIQEVK